VAIAVEELWRSRAWPVEELWRFFAAGIISRENPELVVEELWRLPLRSYGGEKRGPLRSCGGTVEELWRYR